MAAAYESDQDQTFDSFNTEDTLFRQSTDVWYKDGNIIVIAAGEGFRVYSGILAEQSTIFADMLEIPQPTTQATHDGCLLVWLSDSPNELRHLLKAIHNARYTVNERLEFTAICGILRLSTKYALPHIRQRAIEALQHYFPQTLDKFYEAKTARSTIRVGDIFFAANIARKAGAKTLLCSILVVLAQQQLDIILSGVVYPSSATNHIDLELENQLVILRTRHQLCHLARSVTLHALYFSEECSTRKCLMTKRHAGGELLQGRQSDGFINPLSRFQNLSDLALCGSCTEKLKLSIEDGRAKVWMQMPGIFGFESWDALIQEDASPEEFE